MAYAPQSEIRRSGEEISSDANPRPYALAKLKQVRTRIDVAFLPALYVVAAVVESCSQLLHHRMMQTSTSQSNDQDFDWSDVSAVGQRLGLAGAGTGELR